MIRSQCLPPKTRVSRQPPGLPRCLGNSVSYRSADTSSGKAVTSSPEVTLPGTPSPASRNGVLSMTPAKGVRTHLQDLPL